MSTLAELNAAIADYQTGEVGVTAQLVLLQAASAALELTVTTEQASIDAAMAARDAAVAAAQAELLAAQSTFETLVGANRAQYETVLEVLGAYEP
jgi:hypothetical protein